MSFCKNCGKENEIQQAKFCFFCGSSLETENSNVADDESPIEVLEENTEPLSPKEQDFLDVTDRILGWERRALLGCGKAFKIAGIIFTVFCGYCTFMCITDPEYLILLPRWASYTLAAIMLLVCGIIALKAEEKIHTYRDSIYKDFVPTLNRNKNAKKLIISAIFCSVGFVFYLMNFIRIKNNGDIISKILAKQGKI